MKLILVVALFATFPAFSLNCEKEKKAYSEAYKKMNKLNAEWEKADLEQDQIMTKGEGVLNKLKQIDVSVRQAFDNLDKASADMDKANAEWEKTSNGKKANEMIRTAALSGALSGMSITRSEEGNKLMEDILNQYGNEEVKKAYSNMLKASATLEKAIKKHHKGKEYIVSYKKAEKKYSETFKMLHEAINKRNQAEDKLKNCKEKKSHPRFQTVDNNDTIACQLEYISITIYKNGKVTNKAYKEKAGSSSIFTELQSDNPKMIKPDKLKLIKIKEFNGVYWLLSLHGKMATVLFIIDTKNKVMIQQRSTALGATIYGQSWLGKCI